MRVAVYARVSTQRQAQAHSIDQQLERLSERIESRGWKLLDRHIFRDDGYSGANLNRPGLDRLRDAVRLSEVDLVLLTAPDRLARNFLHQMILLGEIERYGCQIDFLEQSISQNPRDQLLLQIQGAVAEYERTLITDRMRRGQQAKYRAGTLLPWTRAPYGYRTNPDRPRDPAGVRIEGVEAAIVERIFAWYNEPQATLYGVAKRLMDEGIASPKGLQRWNVSSVRGILRNPVYSGQVYQGREITAGAGSRHSATHGVGRPRLARKRTDPEQWIEVTSVTAIVSVEQFEAVQAKLADNRRMAGRNNTQHKYLLRALVSCGTCRLASKGRMIPPGYAYYVCGGKDTAMRSCLDSPCRARYAPVSQLDDLVWRDLCKVIEDGQILAKALERAWAGSWLPQELQARREALRKGQSSLKQHIERLTQAYLAGVIGLEECQRRRRDLESKGKVLEEQERQMQSQVEHQIHLIGVVASVEDFRHRIQAGLATATFEQKRLLVELLIDRVIVTEDEVEIHYVVPLAPNSEYTRFCHLRLDYLASVTRGNSGRQASP